MQPVDIKNEFASLENIRPFPTTASRILEIAGQPDCDVRELTQLLECEPSVASKILSMANSPLFGVAREITSISHSIVRLGFRAVSQLAISVYSKELFDAGDPTVAKERASIFRNSLAIATVAKLLSRKLRQSTPDQAFLAGVMHDIGRLLYFDIIPTEYAQIIHQHPDGETVDAELQISGTDHAAVGNQCGLKWGLPAAINESIALHHSPIDQVTAELAKLIIVSNYFARLWQIGFEDGERLAFSEPCEQLIEEGDREELAATCQEQFVALEEICGI